MLFDCDHRWVDDNGRLYFEKCRMWIPSESSMAPRLRAKIIDDIRRWRRVPGSSDKKLVEVLQGLSKECDELHILPEIAPGTTGGTQS